AVEALKSVGETKIPVFGVDALKEAIAMIKSGQMAGTVLNDADNQAKATFELARNLANGRPATEGTTWEMKNYVVRVPYVAVDKSPLAKYIL
ncbi:sugar ABC transporter substrate-binding protein, partial [Psychromonas sp. PRT-SC03]